MDLLKVALTVVKKNLTLFFVLIILAVTAGITHYFLQSYSYISNFKTNNGFVDYTLFKSLTDFNLISSDVYDLPEDELESIENTLANFKVSFVEETTSSISFTAVSRDKNADHSGLQKSVLKLINHNRFIKNSQVNEINVMGKKLHFLKEKIAQLDSLMTTPSISTQISKIPRDAYFLYSQQLDLEDKIESTGRFEIIKPVTEIKTGKKPLLLFSALYLVLGGFLFLLFSKKEKVAKN